MRVPGSHRLQAWAKSVLKRAPGQVAASGFDPAEIPAAPSESVQRTVRQIRGDLPPAIILHGAMGRTGTNYLGALLRLHPDLAGTDDVYEFHFLAHLQDILRMQKRFEADSRKAASGTSSPSDFAALFSATMVTHLYSRVPEGMRLSLKVPAVAFLNYFPVVFAHEHLLLLNRDGRDVVTSWRQSWPQFTFEQVCRDWDRSAKLMLAFQQRVAGAFTFDVIRYEDAVRDPEQIVRRLCEKFSLDVSRYPFEQIEDLPLLGSSSTKSASQDKWQWQMAQKPKDFDPVGRWRTWGETEKRTFKTIAGQSLIDCGYAEDTNW